MSEKTKALALNFVAISCWCISPLAIRYIKESFPVNFQNFFRYFASLFIIWPFFFFSQGKQQSWRTFRLLPGIIGKLLIIAGLNYLFQVTFTASFFLLYPAFGTLMHKAGVIFSIILAAMFFPDERTMLQHRTFQFGFFLALVGMVITIISDKHFGHIEFNLGVLLILTSTLSWAFITVLIKKWLSDIPISFAVSIVLTIVTPCYLLTDIVVGGGLRIPQASLSMWLIMIFSGILAIGIAHSSYYHSVPVLGVALSASLDLSRPFLVALMSFFLYQESLTTLQIVGGGLLIFGSYLVIKLRFQHF